MWVKIGMGFVNVPSGFIFVFHVFIISTSNSEEVMQSALFLRFEKAADHSATSEARRTKERLTLTS